SMHKHLDTSLKRLKVLHQENLDREAKLKEEIEKAKQDRLAQIEAGKEEAKRITETAEKEARNVRMNAKEEARREAERIIQKSKEKFEKLKRNLLAELETRALDLSIQMIKHTFSSEGNEVLQRQFITEIIQELEGLKKSEFSIKTENVKIKTAYPLDSKEREALKKVLSKKIGRSVKLEEKMDEELITGLIIQIDSLIIDGSLRNRLKKMIAYLKDEKKQT
ncbi:MAG: hypothetical protein DRP85_07160, partial [Candidatus Makaraimicrobium thalassicum]